MQISLRGQTFTLLYEKALWKDDERLLIIADIHLGKANHFRKEGISIPLQSQQADYLRLRELFLKMQPEKVYFLGDLFHSTFNKDWHHFEDLIKEFPQIAFTLIKGNHDLINKELFEDLGIAVVKDHIENEHFIYSHAPLETEQDKLNISGHIHPGISLSGKAHQSARMPCFYLNNNIFLLPAFGILTGLYIMDRFKSADIYAVLHNEVKKI